MNNPIKPKSLEGLEARIGHTFRNKEYITVALTHSSYSNEMKAKGQKTPFNERLEFLGDSVLSIVVSSYIFDKYKNKQEGDLTKIRAAVVCEKALAGYAGKFGLGNYLYMGRGEEMTGGRKRASILADAFEALLAAIYLDAGERGMDIIAAFLLPLVQKDLSELESKGIDGDYKTPLQQLVQQTEGDVLEYILIRADGPDHQKTFEVEVRVNSNPCGRGVGTSKRKAEQAAAKAALKVFGIC